MWQSEVEPQLVAESDQWSIAGRIRTAIISPEPARAPCHPSGRSGAQEARQHLDTPLAEAIHARAPGAVHDTGRGRRGLPHYSAGCA